MKLKNLIITAASIFSPFALADRYGVYDDPEYYGGGGTSLIDGVGAIACTIFAYWYLASSYSQWKARKSTGEKVQRDDFIGDIVAPFIGYVILAFFISFPILMIMKAFGGVELVREQWFSVGAVCFGMVAFLRQT